MSLSSTVMNEAAGRRWDLRVVLGLVLLAAAALVGLVGGTGPVDPATTIYP